MEEFDYKEAYEREHERYLRLEEQMLALEEANEELQRKLDKIKNSIFWKMSKPARSCINFVLAKKQRLEQCDGVGDLVRSIRL